MKLNMATALMRSAMCCFNDQAFVESICGTSYELVKVRNQLKKQPLRDILKKAKIVCSAILDGWSIPDAVWATICHQNPRLNCYPLGEIAERAVKKTLISLILKSVASGSAVEHLSQVDRDFLHEFADTNRKELSQHFLKHYFFEICIDYMRRPDVLCNKYNLSKKGRMVSLDAERQLRQTLAKQCEMAAVNFLPYLLEAYNKKEPAEAIKRIRKGFEEVFGIALPKKRNEENLKKNHVNVIIGTRSAATISKHFTLDKKARRFLLYTKRPNVTVSFGALKDLLKHPPHSLVQDLLDIAVAVYMSDLYTKRNPDHSRRIGILMPVRHPDLWSIEKRKIERAIGILGRDDAHINFVKRKKRAEPTDFSLNADKQCVCLFSGGLDSLAGVVWALDNGLTPTLISHYSTPKLAKIQNSLLNELEKKYDKKLKHLSFYVAKSRSRRARYRLSTLPQSIMARYLRSFLFLSLASAVALELKINKVYIFENGPIALNPLISESRINTRTAHPHFLAYFQNMIKSVFGVKLYIKNPFIYMTKGEVVNILARPELRSLIKATNSCWNWARVPLIAKRLGIKGMQESHDGDCLPCIIRRAAIYRAGLWRDDVKYLNDIFKNYPNQVYNPNKFLALVDLLRLCQNVKSLSADELMLYNPDFSVYEEGADPKELINMYREHALEVIYCFRAKANKQFRQAFTSVLV